MLRIFKSLNWQILLMLALTFLLLTFSACRWVKDKPITIASSVWVGYEQMYLARSEGWLDSNKVTLFETASVPESLQALSEGKVDGAALTLDQMLKARAAGLPLTAVLVFDISAGADMLLVRPGIKHLKDLKGRRIGFESSTSSTLLLNEILLKAGLNKRDVTLVPINIDQHNNAWKHKLVDGMITYEPVASQLQMMGAVKLFDSSQMPDTIIDVLAIRNDVLDFSHRDAIRHLVSAHFRALHHLHTNPQDTAYRTARHLGLPPAGVLVAYKGLVLPDIANNYRLLGGSSPKLIRNAAILSAIMTQDGLLKQQDSLRQLLSADYLPAEILHN